MKNYSTEQFASFRIIFGLYLTWHFYTLLPYAVEMFGSGGMFPDPYINPLWIISPVIGISNDTLLEIFVLSLVIASILFMIGFERRFVSFYLWYGWMYLLNRNSLISNPGIPYIGWLLLACTVIPDEGYNLWHKGPKKDWMMPRFIYVSAWILMTAGYTISGVHKLNCPSWIDGTALHHVLSSPLSRNNFLVNLLLQSPPIVLKIHTWISLLAEILFLPLCLFNYARKWYWMFFIMMHLGILSLVNFTDLTLGVMMIHLFTFDNKWLGELPFKHFFGNMKND